MSEHLFLTGTSGAIGSAVARALRARHPRARLTLVDVNEALSRALVVELGGDAVAVRCDLAKSEDAHRALDDARGRFGPVFGLVNCAGFMEVRRFERIDWRRAGDAPGGRSRTPLRLTCTRRRPRDARGRARLRRERRQHGGEGHPAGLRVLLRRESRARDGLRSRTRGACAERGPVVTVYPGAVASALEARAKDQYGRSLMTRLVPTGKPNVLARKIVEALDARKARVVYPSLYAFGFAAAASPIALAFGPEATD